MRRKKLFVLWLIIVFVSIFFVSSSSIAAPKVIKLVFNSPWPPPPTALGVGPDYFMNELEKRSNGRVKFERHWGGALAKGPGSLEAIRTGLIDVGGMAWLYQPGLTPVGMVDYALPFGSSVPRISNRAMRELYKKSPELKKELQDNNIIPFFWYNMLPYGLISKFPINALSDLKGVKIGATGSQLPKWAKAAGATGVNVNSTEMYMALEKNVTQGQIMSLDLATSFKVYEVCKYVTDVGLMAATPLVFGFNSDSFNKLPKDIQKMVFEIGEESTEWYLDWLEKQESKMKIKWRENGATFSALPEAEKIKWVKGMSDFPGDWCKKLEKKGLPGWKIMRTYIQIQRDLGHKFLGNWDLPKNN